MAPRTVLLAGALAVVSAGVVLAVGSQSASTSDGVYTVEQATEGKELYLQVCESCHQPAKFVGAEFTRAYVGRPLSGIDAAMVEMPMDNPGSLTREDIATLIAYFLEMNKYPAGPTPLNGEAAALKGIMVGPLP